MAAIDDMRAALQKHRMLASMRDATDVGKGYTLDSTAQSANDVQKRIGLLPQAGAAQWLQGKPLDDQPPPQPQSPLQYLKGMAYGSDADQDTKLALAGASDPKSRVAGLLAPGAPNIRKNLAWQNLGIDDPDHQAAFEQHIGDPDKFVRDYFAGMHDPTSNLNQFVYSKSPLGKPSFDIAAGLVDPNTGDPIGWTRRILKPQDGIAEHDYFKLGKSAQNSGYGKTLLQNQMDMYPDMGIDKVNLFANIDVGGYAWAKYGFSPDKDSWAALGKDIRQHMRGEGDFAEDIPLPGLTMDDKKGVNAILKSDPKTGMVNLSDLNTDVGAVDARGNPAPLGKALLLGKDWNGSLDLNDANQMARYNAYVGQ